MKKIIIRNFEPNDAASAAEIIRNNLLTINARKYPEQIIQNLIKIYSADDLIRQSSNKTMIVAIMNDKVIGIGSLLNDFISTVFVNIHHHGTGIGRKIMNTLELIAKENNIKTISLHASINAINFYEMQGYQVVSNVESEDFGKSILMKKDLL